MGCAFLLLFQLAPRAVIGIFGSREELYYQFAERYLRIYFLMIIVQGVQPMTVNYFTGTGNVRNGIIISLSRQEFFLILLLLILPIFLGIIGVLVAAPIADFLAFLLAVTLISGNFKRLGGSGQQRAARPPQLPVGGLPQAAFCVHTHLLKSRYLYKKLALWYTIGIHSFKKRRTMAGGKAL